MHEIQIYENMNFLTVFSNKPINRTD